jgi:glycosyltransferase involved in cell wall biosynthesis
MTYHHPEISVIMPVYNREDYLKGAVDSICTQTFTDFEFIIVDDGSTDRTAAVLRQCGRDDARIVIVEQQNKGCTEALNRGLRLARGKFIARMDSDDYSLPHRFERQLAFLHAHPDVVALGCAYEKMDGRGRIFSRSTSPVTHEEIDAVLFRGYCPLNHPSVMMRRSAVVAVGGYDDRYPCGQDYDLWLRLAEVGRLANLPDVLFRYRHHDGAITESQNQLQRDVYRQAWHAACERRGVRFDNEPSFAAWRPTHAKDSYNIARKRARSALEIRQYRSSLYYGFQAFRALTRTPSRLPAVSMGVLRRLISRGFSKQWQ